MAADKLMDLKLDLHKRARLWNCALITMYVIEIIVSMKFLIF